MTVHKWRDYGLSYTSADVQEHPDAAYPFLHAEVLAVCGQFLFDFFWRDRRQPRLRLNPTRKRQVDVNPINR